MAKADQDVFDALGAIVDTYRLLDESVPLQDASERLKVSADSPVGLYASSLKRLDGMLYAIAQVGNERLLAIIAEAGRFDPAFGRARHASSGLEMALCSPDWESYLLLRERFPFVAPVSLRSRRTTIGMGDRLGLATPGHIAAARRFDVSPVLAQQSIRELTLTRRTYRDVVRDAAFGVFREGYEAGYGADGDHLKTIADIDVALEAGMPMITLDLTEVMDPSPASWSSSQIEDRFALLDADAVKLVLERYADKRFELGNGEAHEVRLPTIEAKRCALMYWKALDFTELVDRHLRKARGDSYDLEVSIDETTAPTLPTHHLFIASELQRRRVTVNSLAPRFIGEFQKGIDYIGDPDEFERQFKVHCAIAKRFGGYKISIHSGSDKFSVYPIIGRYTDLRVHVKTAGTSWLEAVRTVSCHDPALYRHIHTSAFACFDEATKLYHITADLRKIAPIDRVEDEALPRYLEQNESRQLLHITYGGLLGDLSIRERLFTFLARFEDEHRDLVYHHLSKHLAALGVGAAP